jgi:uncharacterized protein YggT (Ycf19 family)
MWMILGRIMLTLMFGNRDNVIHRLFAKITDPVYAVVRKLLPFVKESCIPAASILIIIIIRLLMIIILSPAAHKQ